MDDVDARTLIIIPTYNEADNLPSLLREVRGTVGHAHVLIVDDDSPDGTGQIAEALAQTDDHVHVLHGPGKQGLGRAYARGFRWALDQGYDFIFEMDCDFSHQPRHLPSFLERIRTADLVLGSRYIKGGGTENWHWRRRLLSRSGNFYARLMLGMLGFHDLTGGFKCFRRAVLEAIDFEHLLCTGYGFQVELTYRAHLLGFRIAEIPITFPDRTCGESKMSGKIFKEALLTIPRLRLAGLPRQAPRQSSRS